MNHATLQGSWSLWRWVRIRSAGFPVELLGEPAGLTPESDFSTRRQAYADRLRVISQRSDFRQALSWQNPDLLRYCRPQEEVTGGEDLWPRSRRRGLVILTNYLQRYCAKNDNIGFFGPSCWAALGKRTFACKSLGEPLAERGRVHFETWAIQAVLTAFSNRPEVVPHLKPELNPALWLTPEGLGGDQRARGASGERRFFPWQRALLRACDGHASWADVLAQAPSEAGDFLTNALTQGWLRLHPIVPNIDQAEIWLLDWLKSLPDSLGPQLLTLVEPFLQDRDDLSLLAVGEKEVSAKVAEMGTTFENLTGQAARRRPGQTYAARSLVYEDCTRRVEVDLPLAQVRTWVNDLRPLWIAGRWFIDRTEQLYRQAMVTACKGLGERHGWPFRASFLWSATQQLFVGEPPPLITQACAELRQRWAELCLPCQPRSDGSLQLQPSARQLTRLFPHLKEACREGRRQHSLDLLVGRQGERYFPVFGELHVGINSHSTPEAIRSHPDPTQLTRSFLRDCPEPTLRLVPTDDLNRCSMDNWLSPDSYHLVANKPSWRPPHQQIPLRELWVSQDLQMHGSDNRNWDILQMYLRTIRYWCAINFHPWSDGPQAQRCYLGEVVARRRSWQFDTQDVRFVHLDDGEGRYQLATRWAQGAGLPPRFFARVPKEIKPMYFDMGNPWSVDTFMRWLRTAPVVRLQEVLPDLEHAWIEDHRGGKYVSELRMVLVEP